MVIYCLERAKVKLKKTIQPFQKIRFLRFVILAIRSSTRSHQSMWFWIPADGTTTDTTIDIAAYRLNGPKGLKAGSVKVFRQKLNFIPLQK